MIPGSGLFLLGISGILVLYAVLAHLSARMGEGLRVRGYYRIYYIAILFLISGAVYGFYVNGGVPEDIVMILLITGNVLAVAASYRYWWWLKDELWIKKDKGEE